MDNKAILKINQINKAFSRGEVITPVLSNITLQVFAGDFIALMGPSGSGKTTLLNIISGIDKPSSGEVIFNNEMIHSYSESQLADWRRQHIGFVFQQYYLLPVLSALENVELPLMLYDMNKAERKKRAEAALNVVGLSDRMNHYPAQLSRGQEQRVGIARALVTDPSIIIGDEPTGNLDEKTSAEILDLFVGLNQKLHKTIIMVTHDPKAASRANTIYQLEKGCLKRKYETTDEMV